MRLGLFASLFILVLPYHPSCPFPLVVSLSSNPPTSEFQAATQLTIYPSAPFRELPGSLLEQTFLIHWHPLWGPLLELGQLSERRHLRESSVAQSPPGRGRGKGMGPPLPFSAHSTWCGAWHLLLDWWELLVNRNGLSHERNQDTFRWVLNFPCVTTSKKGTE